MWLHNTLQKIVKELLKADSASSIYQKELLKELRLQNRGRHVGIVTDVVKDIFPNVAFHENRTGVMRSRASDSPRHHAQQMMKQQWCCEMRIKIKMEC